MERRGDQEGISGEWINGDDPVWSGRNLMAAAELFGDACEIAKGDFRVVFGERYTVTVKRTGGDDV